MLNLADRATEKAIMEALESEDPDLVEQIRRLMFVFEDILQVDDRGMNSLDCLLRPEV
jgi:flagellar motor switch protein FliG